MSDLWPWLPFVALAQVYLSWRRALGYLRYFQQEAYETARFLRWVNVRSLTDPAFWVSLLASWLAGSRPVMGAILFIGGAALLAAVQPDPRGSGKIPLRLTWRATRVLVLTLMWAFSLWALLSRLFVDSDLQGAIVAAAIVLAGFPLVIVIANACLMPYERRTQQGYEAEAVRRIANIAPFIVGITGSYGKSSSKSMLAHLLQFNGPTLAATGSINTLMGVTRHVREELVHGHKYMVVEMGAFRTGSIRRMCQLTPPSAALITAVGDMHLERFGSTDEIVKAKSELAQALPAGGLLVVNADSPGALRIAKASTSARVLLYGETSPETLATRLEDVSFSKAGTTFTLRTPQAVYECFTPVHGRPIVLNLTGVFTLATALGLDPAVAVAAMRTLKPVSNRLEVVEEGGVTWIRDAYNSNQFGFRAALEVAAALPVARRFLATPGCIELGAQQFEVNRALSKAAADTCENTLVVSDTNKDAFIAGHRDAGREARLVPVPTRAEAFRWIGQMVKEGDAVILENDLPDLYEKSAGLFWPERAGQGA